VEEVTCLAEEADGLALLFWEKCWEAQAVAVVDGPEEGEAGPAVEVVLEDLAAAAAAVAAPVVVNDKDELANIFYRANSTIVNGEKVILVRKNKNGRSEKFDEMSTQEDLEQFRKRVLKYLH